MKFTNELNNKLTAFLTAAIGLFMFLRSNISRTTKQPKHNQHRSNATNTHRIPKHLPKHF